MGSLSLHTRDVAGWTGQEGAPAMFTVTTSESLDFVTIAKFAHSDSIVYLLTTCCGASATGTEHGTACRACYKPIPDTMGMAWTADQFVATYPEWCAAHGLTEMMPGVFARHAARVARELGI